MKIKKLRLMLGLTQDEIAKKAKISVMSYKRYEYGERIPDAQTAVLIADALGTTVKELWGPSK